MAETTTKENLEKIFEEIAAESARKKNEIEDLNLKKFLHGSLQYDIYSE